MLPGDAPGYRVLDQAGQGGFAIVYRATGMVNFAVFLVTDLR